jgi:glutamate dehydrogenase (NAD(P)+)
VVYATINGLKEFGAELGIGTEIKGQTVAVQAMGNVGGHAARIFHKIGAKVVAVSDFPGMILDRDGIDIDGLLRRIAKDGMQKAFEKTKGFAPVTKGTAPILELPVNILVPAFREKQITAHNAARVWAKLIVEGANGPTTPEADEILENKGIRVIPDILANGGGVIVSYFEWLQNLKGEHWYEVPVNRMLEQRMHVSCRDIFVFAKARGISLRLAATAVAVQRIVAAKNASRAYRDALHAQRLIDGSYKPYRDYDILDN